MVSPVCHRRCSTYDRRGRTSWHLDIWQYETIVHCAVPNAPKDSVPAARIPWGSSRRRITALFEAQLIVCHERCGHGLCTRQPTCIWRLLGKATSKARDAADYSGVVRVGTGDTAKRCNQSCISIMADLDRQRPAPHARPLSHIRVYRKRARPLREKWQKEYMRRIHASS